METIEERPVFLFPATTHNGNTSLLRQACFERKLRFWLIQKEGAASLSCGEGRETLVHTEGGGMESCSRNEDDVAELRAEAGREPEGQEIPPVTERAVDECDIRSWYPALGHTSFGSEIIPLPEEFVAYLLQDGLHLPATSQAVSGCSSALPPCTLGYGNREALLAKPCRPRRYSGRAGYPSLAYILMGTGQRCHIGMRSAQTSLAGGLGVKRVAGLQWQFSFCAMLEHAAPASRRCWRMGSPHRRLHPLGRRRGHDRGA